MFKYLNIGGVVAWLVARKRVIIFISLAVLISTISFAAGYLLARESNEAPIIISSPAPSGRELRNSTSVIPAEAGIQI